MSDISPLLNPYEQAVAAYAAANPNALMTVPQFLSAGGTVKIPIELVMASRYPSVDPGTTTLSGAEWQSLLRIFYNSFLNRFTLGTQVPFRTKLAIVAEAAATAKSQLPGTLGPLSNGSLIPQEIRPVTVYANGGTEVEDWSVTGVSAGWTSVTPVFTINLNATSSTIAISPQNRVVMVILGIGDLTSSPKINEYQWTDPGQKPLGIHGLPAATAFGEVNIWEFSEAILIQKNMQFKLNVNWASAGAARPVLFGLQFVTPEYAPST